MQQLLDRALALSSEADTIRMLCKMQFRLLCADFMTVRKEEFWTRCRGISTMHAVLSDLQQVTPHPPRLQCQLFREALMAIEIRHHWLVRMNTRNRNLLKAQAFSKRGVFPLSPRYVYLGGTVQFRPYPQSMDSWTKTKSF